MQPIKAYLIDPEARTIREIEFSHESTMLAKMHEMIGAGILDHQIISDEHDCLWVDDGGLKRGQPIYAFKLPMQKDPYAGRAIVIGANDRGRTRSPTPALLQCLRRDVEWLGRIIPEVVWDRTERGARAVVTYARAR